MVSFFSFYSLFKINHWWVAQQCSNETSAIFVILVVVLLSPLCTHEWYSDLTLLRQSVSLCPLSRNISSIGWKSKYDFTELCIFSRRIFSNKMFNECGEMICHDDFVRIWIMNLSRGLKIPFALRGHQNKRVPVNVVSVQTKANAHALHIKSSSRASNSLFG